MHTWIDTVVEPATAPPPVDDLLRIYLGQTSDSRVPVGAASIAEVQDLWDYLGDFA